MTPGTAATEEDTRIAVIGGGILGMALANRLRDEGYDPEILEGASRAGGLASPDRIGEFTWDRFYHVILLSDLHLRRLLDELDLSAHLRWGTTKTGFYSDGELYSLSSSIEFLRFPPLSILDKLRLGWTIFFASRLKDWRRLEEVLVGTWLTRWSGPRVYERIWLPLLRSKLGDNHRIASAAFIWAIIQRMYGARQSGLKREMFGYVDGGYEVILTRFQEHLESKGVTTRLGAEVTEVTSASGRVTIRFEDGSSREYQSAILTVPAPVVAKLCPQLSEREKTRLQEVTYQGIVCASLLLRKPLAEYYVTNITDNWLPFTGVIELTALVDKSAFKGNSLIYLPRYLTQHDSFWSKTDSEVEREFLSALMRMYPSFRTEDVLEFKISRARRVLAVSTLGYSENLMPPVESSLPGVFVVNSAQIANGTLNVNESIGLVESNLPTILESLCKRRSSLPSRQR